MDADVNEGGGEIIGSLSPLAGAPEFNRIQRQNCLICDRPNRADDKAMNVCLGECHLTCLMLLMAEDEKSPRSEVQGPKLIA